MVLIKVPRFLGKLLLVLSSWFSLDLKVKAIMKVMVCVHFIQVAEYSSLASQAVYIVTQIYVRG